MKLPVESRGQRIKVKHRTIDRLVIKSNQLIEVNLSMNGFDFFKFFFVVFERQF